MDPNGNHKESSAEGFQVFRDIIQGHLRPHLKEFSDENAIKKRMERSYPLVEITTDSIKNGIQFSEEFLFNNRIEPGDSVSIKLIPPTQENEPGILEVTKLEPEDEEPIFDLNIPPPSDLKSEFFLDLIEDEFYRIKKKSMMRLEKASSEAELSFYANQSLQILKGLCQEALLLSKKIGSLDEDGHDRWEPVNSYIMYVLKYYLISSIEHYQELFKPYLKVEPQTEEDLRFELFNQWPLRFSKRHRETNEKMEARRAAKGLPPLPKFEYGPEGSLEAFMKRHPTRFREVQHLVEDKVPTKKAAGINVPPEVIKKLQDLKDKEGGKVLAARLNISERTLYDVLKRKAGAITCRKIAAADPQFLQLAELA